MKNIKSQMKTDVRNNVYGKMFRMRGIILVTLITFSFLQLTAQNVGIGTTIPSQKLDVKGNINISGNLLLSETAGQAGQVLTTNAQGNTEWASVGTYNNIATYTTTGTFTIPLGISRIKVEGWGGGSGAGTKKGGASGGYICGFFAVSPAQSVTITIGSGGVGGRLGGTSGPGGNTIIIVGNVTLTALGGIGTSTNATGLISSNGEGGGYTVSPGTFRNYIGLFGNIGGYTKIQYTTNNASVFWKETSFGDGGDAPNWPTQTGGRGEYFIQGNNNYMEGATGRIPQRPGGGGASNSAFVHQGGAPGLVRIWY